MAKATGPTYRLAFKRRRKNLTNYKKRLALLKSGLPRFVVRKSNRNITVQCIDFSLGNDKVIARADSRELSKYGWKNSTNLPSAYLVGLMCAKRALSSGVKSAVLDSGLHTPSKGSFMFASVKGAIDAGLEIPVGEIEFDEERISGRHISEYAKSVSGSEKYNKLFAAYIKKGVKPEEIDSLFQKVKEQISKENLQVKQPKEKQQGKQSKSE